MQTLIVDVKSNQDEEYESDIKLEKLRERYDDELYIWKIRKATSDYGVLGISLGASAQDIRKAYTYLSEKVHPNKNKSHGATEAFKKLQSAYNSLKKRAN